MTDLVERGKRMKKAVLGLLVAPLLFASNVWADAQQDFSARLDKVNAFTADFQQKL